MVCRVFVGANQGFHLGYAGRGPYTGFGGGRYGGRGRPGSRLLVHHPGFVVQRSRGSGGIESQGHASTVREEEAQL
jgi:hypothetical protein